MRLSCVALGDESDNVVAQVEARGKGPAGESARHPSGSMMLGELPMESTAELVGFFAAHGIWCVSEGVTMPPLIAYEDQAGERCVLQLPVENMQSAIRLGRDWIDENPLKAVRALLMFDGRITLPAGKTDAILIEASLLLPERESFSMAIPYRHAKDPAGFAVHRPKFIAFDNPDPAAAIAIVGEPFFRGVAHHEHGGRIWDDHLDESV